MQEAARWAIHVASWNDAAQLRDLVSSVEQQTIKDVQCVLVDYARNEGSAGEIATSHPNVVVLRQAREGGFAKAHNQAFALTLARWPKENLEQRFVLLVHPDTILEPHALERLEECFTADPSLVLASPRVLRANIKKGEEGDSREVIFSETIDQDGWLIGKAGKITWQNTGAEAMSAEVAENAWPSSVACAIRASFLHGLQQQGWLDERFEERSAWLDLVWRARWAGGNVSVVKQAMVWHHAHQPLDKMAHFAYKRWYDKEVLEVRKARVIEGFIQYVSLPTRYAFKFAFSFILSALRWLGVALTDPRLWPSLGRAIRLFPHLVSTRWKNKSKKRIQPKTVRAWFV